MLKVLIWHTPKGIIDEGGKELEGYINFNITLLAPPENDLMNVSQLMLYVYSLVVSVFQMNMVTRHWPRTLVDRVLIHLLLQCRV